MTARVAALGFHGGPGPHVTADRVSEGQYFCSDHELYYVELRDGETVLLEDCRTGSLVDAAVSDVIRLRLVDVAARAPR